MIEPYVGMRFRVWGDEYVIVSADYFTKYRRLRDAATFQTATETATLHFKTGWWVRILNPIESLMEIVE